ncbi:uncharacterized protein LOC117190699 [Drosophila miranda]|uniref:uncharacterized protein LOC117190699 n=1 Tax=Drosophila miranda TaxID=7229 RepID=UPI00143F80CD|nr:uncharacterized protein LOC117190699 [Drosophila miranda]
MARRGILGVRRRPAQGNHGPRPANHKQDTTLRPRKQNRATPRSMDYQQENPNGPIPDTSWDDGWHARLQEWDAQEEAAAPERRENPDWQPLDHAPMKWISPVSTDHNPPNPEPTSCTAREAEPGNASQPKEDSDLSLGLEEAEAGGLLTAFEEMPELNTLQEEQEWPIAPVAWRVSTPDRRIPQSLLEGASAQANAARHARSRIRSLEHHDGQRFRVCISGNLVRISPRPTPK